MNKVYTPIPFMLSFLTTYKVAKKIHRFLYTSFSKNIITVLLLLSGMFWSGNVWGQTTYTWTSGTTWLGGTWNYTTYTGANTYPGNKTTTTNNDIAYFNNNTNTSVTNNYINMNTQSGTHYLGAVDFGTSATTARAISNSSSSTSGIMYLNGVTLNSVANTVIWNESSATHSFTVANTFGIGLNNTTNNVIQITGTGGITIAAIISGTSKNLTKSGSGSGVLLLSGANTYTGTTTITTGTLQLGVANALPIGNPGGGIILNGGTLSTGAMTGFSDGTSSTSNMGTLTLNDNSIITLGTGLHNLYFAASNGISWTSGKVLTITGWTGTVGACTTGTAGKIFVGNSASLTEGQLAQIKFTVSGVNYPAKQLSTGEIIPALKLVVTNPGNQTAGVGFSITVTTKDFDGIARTVTANTDITLSSSTNTIGGTFTGTINSGFNNVTISGVTLTVGNNATITAVSSNGNCLVTGISTNFDVSAASGHTVTFKANGGTGSDYTQNSSVAANLSNNTFTRTGYTFAGWNTVAGGGGTPFTNNQNYDFSADMTLYAQWNINSYSLAYDGNDNDGGTINTGGTYNYNSAITLPTPTMTKTGYTFSGWNTLANGSGTNYLAGATYNIPAANSTLYAKWTINNYTITFSGNSQTSGSPSATSVSGNYNTNVTLASFGSLVKTGYTFNGWNTASDGSGTDYAAGSTYNNISSSFTLYAKWTINSYTVTFNGNSQTSGSPDISSVSGNYNTSVTLATIGTLVKTGYTFNGWNTLTNGSGTNYTAGSSYTMGASNITLYAKWTINNYDVIFDKNNASATGSMSNKTYAYGSTANLTTNAYALTGYAFKEWNTAADGSGTAYANSASYTMSSTSNVTLYAQWIPVLSATALTDFGTQCVDGTYGPNKFTITGSNLTTADVTVAALSGFTYCTTAGGTYSSSLSLTQPGGAYSQDIYVKFAPTAGGSYNGNIVVSGGGASTINVAAKGTGLAKATPTVSIASVPAAVSGTTTICSGTNVLFTATASNLGGGSVATYQWKLNGSNVGTNSSSYSNNALVSTDYISCAITVSGGCVTATTASSNTINMVVNPTPANDLCSNAPLLTVNAAATSGTMTPCAGYETPFSSKKDVWYKVTAPCNADYTITLAGYSGDMDMALFYNGNSCPSTTTTLASSTTSNPTESITYTMTMGNTYYIRVYAFNTAAESSTFNIQVTGNTSVPAQPNSIVGESSVCPSSEQTYSIDAVANTTGYTWSVPSGWAITSGAGTTDITVTAGSTGGTISVTADNGCGSSTARTLSVSMLTVPTAPVATAGNAITGASFTANWNSVAGATGYFVDVYANTAIIDDFTDGNFTANPVWVGNTSDFSILTNSTLPSGNASTDGSFLGTNASSGKVTLMTASTENTEWKFSLGSPDFDPSSSNYFGIILMSSTSFSGDISASFNGYYLKIGVDGSSDYIELWKSNAAAKTKIGNFTSAGNFGSGALKNGLNMRITRDNSGVFQLFYSTGFTYPSDPTTNGGTLTDNTFSTSSYFGVYQYITSTSTSRRVYFDNMQLGSMSFVTGYENIYTTGTSLSVTGLTPSTTYYYVVRADNGSCTSANSNEISVTTNSCSGAAHIVSSILPTTGPVGTTVILKGSGFTAVTDVEIGGIVVTDYTVSDNNTIVLRIPDGATTGTIDVFNNGCPKSSGTFTVLNSNGACGGGATATVTDLMISEVYDSETGSRGYIELFNGTSASINLSNYKIKINTGAITWVSLSGTLAPNQFAVVKIGNTGTSCDASIAGTGALIINRSTSSGYNENDDIELYKGATKIDRMVTPNELGYNMERNTLTNAPSTTFTSGNWTKTSTEACSSLGNPSFTVAPLLVINTHPTDWTSCPGTVQFSVAATATPSPVTSYAWYYNDLQSMTGWQLVSGNISGASGTNTATLSLPADFAPLYNYQFYCNVVKTNGGNTCTKTTNAAVFKYPTARYYRTKTSTTNGNWATAAQWEMSNDINFVSPAPITACAYPIAVNSSAVFVQSGTKTTLGTGSGDNFDIEIDKITIDGTLEINIDSKLTVNDSTVGADMLVNGILIDRGNSTNGIDFRGTSYTNGSGWILGNAGTVIKTSTSSVVYYRDFYQGGISNIPDGSSGAQWIYRYNGDGNPSTNAVGMFYPNLYFENANAGNFAFNNNLMALIGGSGGFCTVKGNLNVGTTGVGTVTAYNNNINTQAMKVLGNMTIGLGSTFTNVSYDNTVVANTRGHGTGIELYGNLTNNGTLTNNGGNSGILRFKGSGTQTVSGSGTFNLWNVELDKPSQTIVDQLVNLTTQNNLNFVHGILKTNSNVFTVSNGDKTNAVTGYDAPNNTGMYSDDKYVFGKLERAINTTGIYDFPVGDAVAGKAYNPIQLEISSGAGNATAQFIPADMSTHTCVAGPTFFTCIGKSHFYHYTGMTGQGIWRMGSSTGTTFSYNVILHPNTKNNNVNPNDDVESGGLFYKEVYRALKATNGTTDWSSYAGGGDKCTVGNYYSVPGNGYSGFSDFGIPGGSGASTPLPIELISFTGQCNDGETVLKWSTASERDSKEFLVQRSDNNRNYATIATIPSAGFSNILRNYSYIDKIANGKNYYRLMEVANNGKESTHPIIYVTCEETNNLHIYYSEPKIIIEANSTSNKDLLFNVFEVSGKLLHSEHKAIQKGFNRFELNIHATLAKGVYIIQSIDGEKVEAVKVMVH